MTVKNPRAMQEATEAFIRRTGLKPTVLEDAQPTRGAILRGEFSRRSDAYLDTLSDAEREAMFDDWLAATSSATLREIVKRERAELTRRGEPDK